MGEKKSFVMYKSWGAAIKNMDDAQAGALLKAIYAYQTEGKNELEDSSVSFVFDLIREKFEDDAEKYEKECRKKAENGRKGGMAKAGNAKQELASAKSAKQELASAKSAKQELASAKSAKQELASAKSAKQELASAKSAKQELASAKSAKQELAKPSKTKQNLHDTDTESDTDTDTDTLFESSNKGGKRAHSCPPEDPFALTQEEEAELTGLMGSINLEHYKAKVRDWYKSKGLSLPRSYAAEIRRWYEADISSHSIARSKPPDRHPDVPKAREPDKYAMMERAEFGVMT